MGPECVEGKGPLDQPRIFRCSAGQFKEYPEVAIFGKERICIPTGTRNPGNPSSAPSRFCPYLWLGRPTPWKMEEPAREDTVTKAWHRGVISASSLQHQGPATQKYESALVQRASEAMRAGLPCLLLLL